MMKKIYPIIIIITLIFLLLFMFSNSTIINQTIAFSIDIFKTSIFPSLFPMFIISNLLIEIKIPDLLGTILQKPMSLFYKINKNSSFILILSMLTGFPSSAKYINDLLDKEMININDAKKILNFSFFANPLFIINTVGILFLNNKTYGFLILIAHITSNFILGLLLRNYNVSITNENTSLKNSLNNVILSINNSNIFKILFDTIKNSLFLLLSIFGTITFFLILTNFLTFKINDLFIKTLVAGLLEMTSGLKYVSLLDIDIKVKAFLSLGFLSFGGICIHTQIMSILGKRGLSYLFFFLFRCLHVIISFVVLFLLFFFTSL